MHKNQSPLGPRMGIIDVGGSCRRTCISSAKSVC